MEHCLTKSFGNSYAKVSALFVPDEGFHEVSPHLLSAELARRDSESDHRAEVGSVAQNLQRLWLRLSRESTSTEIFSPVSDSPSIEGRFVLVILGCIYEPARKSQVSIQKG